MRIYNRIKAGLRTCVVLTAVMMLSCEVTELTPDNAVAEELAFTTPSNIERAAIGMYNAAQSGFYLGSFTANRGYPFGAAHVQQGDMRGEDMVNVALFYAITNEATYTTATANNVEMWNNLFALINQTNVVIEGVRSAAQKSIITATDAAAYEGEARALRALAYHELAVHFCRPYADNPQSNYGVPIRDFAVNTPEKVAAATLIDRGTVAAVYTFILQDLDFAEANLPASRSGVSNNIRFTSPAAIALKTRVKLHMQDWAGVLQEGAKVNFASRMATTPSAPFRTNTSSEVLFAVENSTTDNPGANGALAAMFGIPTLGGRGLVVVSPIIYNNASFPANDLRKTSLMTADTRSYYTTKYTDYVSRGDDAPVIRAAEVLLNMAEASARLNGLTQAAVDLLSSVRNRSVPDAANRYTLASFADASALLTAIITERRIEFIAEGLRWKDIHRLALDPVVGTNGIPSKMTFANATFASYGSAGALTRGIPAIPYSDNRFLWPIPATELGLNPILAPQQNPGY